MGKLHQTLTFLFVCLPFVLSSQNDYIIDVQHFTTEDGLSHRAVKTVFQDSRGLIWISTRYGLNRFDGHNFKIFSKEKQGLSSNDLTQILEDEDGWLWACSAIQPGKSTNLSFINVKTAEVRQIEERFGNTFPFNIDSLSGMVAGPDKSVYLSAGRQIYQYKSQQFKSIYQSDQRITVVANTPNDMLLGYQWVSPELIEPFVFDSTMHASGQSIPIKPMPTIKGVGDRSGNCWLLILNNLYLLEANKKNWKKQNIAEFLGTDQFTRHFMMQFEHDANSNAYWYKDGAHLHLFHPYEGIRLDMNEHYPEITQSSIIDIVIDQSGNIWVCTDFGVFKIRLSKNSFQNYLSQPTEQYDINTAFSTRGITLKNGQLWANSNSEKQYLVNLEDGQYEQLQLPPSYQLDDEPFKKLAFRPILKVSENEFYTDGGPGLLLQYDKKGPGKIRYWKKSAHNSMAWSIFKEKDQIWLGLLDIGLGIVKEDSITNYQKYNGFDALSRSSVYHFLQWDEEHVLLATTSGIYVLHLQKGIVKRFWTKGGEAAQLPFDLFYHLTWDVKEENILWAASGGGGLIRLSLDKEKLDVRQYEQYTIADGLSNNVLYAVYPDDYDNLWLPSDYGLIQFHKRTKSSRAFTVLDGIPFNEFNRLAHFAAPDGRLFFGTMNGITSFYPKALLNIEESFDIPLRVIRFQQFNGTENQLEDRTTDLVTNNKITLHPGDKFLTLAFALLEYKDANQIKYSYQLKGQSDEWVYLNQNELRLSGLPYGNFTLNVRAQGVSGQFSESRLSIPIAVLRPFYLTGWFFLFAGLILSATLLVGYNVRTHALRKRQEELEEQVTKRTAVIAAQTEELRNMDAIKSRFFANVSHELRTPLTLLLGPINSALEKGDLNNRNFTLLKLAQNNGQQLLKLVNSILDLTRLESGKLELKEETVAFHPLIKRIISQFESGAQVQNIDLIIDYQPDPYLQLRLDTTKFETIVNNLLSNALKFTADKGTITMTIKDQGNQIQLEVNDTGKGIHPEDLPHIFNRFYQSKRPNAPTEGGSGIGLALSRELAQLFNGALEVESELGKGSTFFFRFPKKEVMGFASLEATGQSPVPVNPLPARSFSQGALQLNSPAETLAGINRPTILLVEDNHNMREYLNIVLGEQYNLISAENGQVAWRILEVEGPPKSNVPLSSTFYQEPSLIISDIMMPVMDGYQLLGRLKSDDRWRQVPTIMLTARAELDDKLKALRIGVDDYMLKPFGEQELLLRIENLLKNSRARQTATQKKAPAIDPQVTSTDNLPLTPLDHQWLAELETLVKDNLDRFEFTVDDLAHKMAMSRRQFYYEVKKLTGLTPNQYIQEIRFAQARRLLESGSHRSVKSVVYAVGLKDTAYFSRQFKKRYGKLPSAFF
ncbi:MAG: ATP-binding protein [Bacteroidota bacterium]